MAPYRHRFCAFVAALSVSAIAMVAPARASEDQNGAGGHLSRLLLGVRRISLAFAPGFPALEGGLRETTSERDDGAPEGSLEHALATQRNFPRELLALLGGPACPEAARLRCAGRNVKELLPPLPLVIRQ